MTNRFWRMYLILHHLQQCNMISAQCNNAAYKEKRSTAIRKRCVQMLKKSTRCKRFTIEGGVQRLLKWAEFICIPITSAALTDLRDWQFETLNQRYSRNQFTTCRENLLSKVHSSKEICLRECARTVHPLLGDINDAVRARRSAPK